MPLPVGHDDGAMQRTVIAGLRALFARLQHALGMLPLRGSVGLLVVAAGRAEHPLCRRG